MTSNEAEYTVVHKALEAAGTKEIEILSDSKLVVNQLNREWHIKDERMRELFDRIHKLIRERVLKVEFKWVPRKDNPAGKYLG